MRPAFLLIATALLSACGGVPEAMNLASIEGALVRDVNFNGKGGFEFDGYRWTSQADSKANGMMLRDVEVLTTDLQPQPRTNENIQHLLNTSIAQTGQLNIDQVMYGAQYNLYFWFMENQRGAQRSMSIEVEGQLVETEMGNLPYKNWARFGPYSVDLSDGELNIVLATVDLSHKAEVMGMLLIKPEN